MLNKVSIRVELKIGLSEPDGDVPPKYSREVLRYWAQSQAKGLCCQTKDQNQMTHNADLGGPEDQVRAGSTSFNTMGKPEKNAKFKK
jgi:hypothetical protein